MQKVYQSYVLPTSSSVPCSLLPAPLPLLLFRSTLFLDWAWLTCQAGRQAKMQIFVKYMRVKIVVLHYPFNWIWRAHAGLKANANTS